MGITGWPTQRNFLRAVCVAAVVSVVAACGAFVQLAAGEAMAARAKPSVRHCLRRAGLNDVTETSADRWQGVVGHHPLSDEIASVFVVGPYSSAKAVRRAVPTAGKGEVAAAGGLYLLIGNAAGHVARPIASAAACLRPTASGPHKSKPTKQYGF